MRIAFIGSGAMGEAMISALLRHGATGQGDIRACDIDSARLNYIREEYRVDCTSDIDNAIAGRDVVVLSIKPQTLNDVMTGLKGKLGREQLVLSIVAGAAIDRVSKGLGHEAVVRVMPNTPAQVSQGMSVWTATGAVSQGQRETAQAILRAMGKEIYVSDEKYIDMATAVSGCGPAYIFLLMEALTDGAVHIGLPRGTAEELVLQTVLGSAHMAQESGKHLAELKNMVSTPGGSTVEGLLCLEKGGTRAALAQAVIAAYEKARLGGGQGS